MAITLWMAIAAGLSPLVAGQLCAQNLGSDFFIVANGTLLADAPSACHAQGLMFAQVPDHRVAQDMALLVGACGGAGAWLLGYQGQAPLGCAILDAALNHVAFVEGQACTDQSLYVLCTDKDEFAAVQAASEGDTPTATATTVVTTVTVGDTTTVATVTAGPFTVTSTAMVSLTQRMIQRLSSTTTTTTTATAIPFAVSSSILPPPAELCPTRRISSCPCEPSRNGLLLVHNHIRFEEAECACRRIGADIADIDDFDLIPASMMLKQCGLQKSADGKGRGEPAWIGSWRGQRTDSQGLLEGGAVGGQELCLVLRPDGSVLPASCDARRPVLCRAPYWMVDSGCHSCQFKWTMHCRHCPPAAQRRNTWDAACISPKRRPRSPPSDPSSSSGSHLWIQKTGHRSKGDAQVTYQVCPLTENLVFAITLFNDAGMGLTREQACGLQNGRLLNLTDSAVVADALRVVSLCGLTSGWVAGFNVASAVDAASCAYLMGPAGATESRVVFELHRDNCLAHRPILCRWDSKAAIPEGPFKAGTQNAGIATVTETHTITAKTTHTLTTFTVLFTTTRPNYFTVVSTRTSTQLSLRTVTRTV